MFYTWGVSRHPHICTLLYIHTPPYICMPPGVYMPPICPHTPQCLCVFWRLCMLWGVVMVPLCVGTPSLTSPLFGVPPLHLHPPHSVIGSLHIGMFQGYQYVMWVFPFCQEGFGGVSPISLGEGASAFEMSICSFLYIFYNALCLIFPLQL